MGIEIGRTPVCWFCKYAKFEIDEERLRIGSFSDDVAPPSLRGTCSGAIVGVYTPSEGVWEKLNKTIKGHKISAQQPCNLAVNAENGDLENFAYVFTPKNTAS